MTLNIENELEVDLGMDYEKIIRDVAEAALEFEDCPYEVELNVVLTTDEEIAMINRDYRDIFKPTDVLSFPMVEFTPPGDFSMLDSCEPEDYFEPDTGELMLGDIIISGNKVIEQAEAYGHSRERELGFLVVHSMLHLFGYDHMEPEETEVMKVKQNSILNMLNLKR